MDTCSSARRGTGQANWRQGPEPRECCAAPRRTARFDQCRVSITSQQWPELATALHSAHARRAATGPWGGVSPPPPQAQLLLNQPCQAAISSRPSSLSRPKEARKRPPERAEKHERARAAGGHGHGGRGGHVAQHHTPGRVAPAARRRRLHLQPHLHGAQPQLLPPPPPLLRRLPVPLQRQQLQREHGLRRRLPQCGRVPGTLLLLRRLLPPLPALRAPRLGPRPPRARARDVARPRRRRRRRRPPQEAHDQEPRVRRALPRAQAGPRVRAREGGAVPAAGEREAPCQVRAGYQWRCRCR